MTLHPLLTYCQNVHPAETLDGLLEVLAGPAARVRAAWRGPPSSGHPAPVMAAGLWLPLEVARAIATDDAAAARVRAALDAAGLFACTANAFPVGGFHAARVKEAVYRPTWLEPARLEFTRLACRALARLLPPGARGSVSTAPVSWRSFGDADAAGLAAAGAHLGALVADLLTLEDETGHEVAVALEPEPRCVLETCAELVAFLEAHVFAGAGREALVARGLPPEGAEAALRRLVGACVDACHLAVVFEPLEQALDLLEARGVRVVKAQLSAAPDLSRPVDAPAGRRRLAAFAEPRYLHQTFGRRPDGGLVAAEDLPEALSADGELTAPFADVERLRTHFHVPLHWGGDEALGTTRPELEAGLVALARATDHLEVETYTFDVLPPELRQGGVEAMVTAELRWAEAALRAQGVSPR